MKKKIALWECEDYLSSEKICIFLQKAWGNGCTLCGGILDLGMINDACLTELTPEWVDENGEGRCGA